MFDADEYEGCWSCIHVGISMEEDPCKSCYDLDHYERKDCVCDATIEEKHELTLSFDSSEELWQVAKKYPDNVVSMVDYKFSKWEQEDEDDKFSTWKEEDENA